MEIDQQRVQKRSLESISDLETPNDNNPPKKKRKLPQQYGELNPLNLNKIDVSTMILNREIVIGPPPTGRGCSSDMWKRGLHFLFYSNNEKEVINFFYCDRCGEVMNVILETGSSNLKNHIDRHDTEKYSIPKKEFADILHQVMVMASKNGVATVANIKKCLPVKKRWSHDFLKSIKLYAVKKNFRAVVRLDRKDANLNVSEANAANIAMPSSFQTKQDKIRIQLEKARQKAEKAELKLKQTELQGKALEVVLQTKQQSKSKTQKNHRRFTIF